MQETNRTAYAKAAGRNRRKAAIVIAILLVFAILLSGTYAWTSINQIAFNEAFGTSNPGGRVHDDYDGKNKDVYAENFGTARLYVRIRLNEYMEVGAGAGLKSTDGGATPNTGNHAAPFTDGTDIDHKENWPAHIPGASPADCGLGENGQIHKYVSWTLGGSKVFMPTYNKDRTDLSTDASGKAIDEIAGGQTAIGRDKTAGDVNDGGHDYWMPGEKVTADEQFWDKDANGGAGAPGLKAGVEHTAKYTLLPENGGVMTMADWKSAGGPLGAFWVYDTDGWAYFAKALSPGEATPLLLDGIDIAEPDDDWYYCIDVVGQFATEADLNKFGEGTETITADGAALLAKAAGKDITP